MTISCRGIRGATTSLENSRDAILEATREMLEQIVQVNELGLDDIAATFFTTTEDLNAEFPAVAARQLGWEDVPLICGHEIRKPDGLPSCIRVLILVNTTKTHQQIKHLYLRGAVSLRSGDISS